MSEKSPSNFLGGPMERLRNSMKQLREELEGSMEKFRDKLDRLRLGLTAEPLDFVTERQFCYSEYTFYVGQNLKMRRLFEETKLEYQSPGKIIGFKSEKGVLFVYIRRYSASEERWIIEPYKVQDFIKMFENGDIHWIVLNEIDGLVKEALKAKSQHRESLAEKRDPINNSEDGEVGGRKTT